MHSVSEQRGGARRNVSQHIFTRCVHDNWMLHFDWENALLSPSLFPPLLAQSCQKACSVSQTHLLGDEDHSGSYHGSCVLNITPVFLLHIHRRNALLLHTPDRAQPHHDSTPTDDQLLCPSGGPAVATSLSTCNMRSQQDSTLGTLIPVVAAFEGCAAEPLAGTA